MQILTKAEYNQMVQRGASNVWDPLGDNPVISSEWAAEQVDEGNQDLVKDRMKEAIRDEAELQIAALDGENSVLWGSIVEHSERLAGQNLPTAHNLDTLLRKAAIEALRADIKHEVFGMARSYISE